MVVGRRALESTAPDRMTVHVVVARFREDLAWVPRACQGTHARVFVYDKGPDPDPADTRLPNVGREAHTFLHHIVHHYHALPDATLFLQGNPFDHGLGPDRLRELVVQGAAFPGSHRPLRDPGVEALVADRQGGPHHPGLPVARLFGLVFPGVDPPHTFAFQPGAQYAVKREGLTNKPLAFWEDLLRRSSEGVFPWTMERLWPHAFA